MPRKTRAIDRTVLAATLCCCAVTARAQSSGTQTGNRMPDTTTGRSATAETGSLPFDGIEESPSLRVSRINARREDIHRRLEQNADRLLQLTAQLRSDLLHGEMTEADSRRLDEIAKLARAVRDQMRQ